MLHTYPTLTGPHLYRGSTQNKGMAMVPKQALVVMGCEIARLLQLTQNSIVPISYVVQRKVHLHLMTVVYPLRMSQYNSIW